MEKNNKTKIITPQIIALTVVAIVLLGIAIAISPNPKDTTEKAKNSEAVVDTDVSGEYTEGKLLQAYLNKYGDKVEKVDRLNLIRTVQLDNGMTRIIYLADTADDLPNYYLYDEGVVDKELQSNSISSTHSDALLFAVNTNDEMKFLTIVDFKPEYSVSNIVPLKAEKLNQNKSLDDVHDYDFNVISYNIGSCDNNFDIKESNIFEYNNHLYYMCKTESKDLTHSIDYKDEWVGAPSQYNEDCDSNKKHVLYKYAVLDLEDNNYGLTDDELLNKINFSKESLNLIKSKGYEADKHVENNELGLGVKYESLMEKISLTDDDINDATEKDNTEEEENTDEESTDTEEVSDTEELSDNNIEDFIDLNTLVDTGYINLITAIEFSKLTFEIE